MTFLKMFLVLIFLSGCATIVGKSDFDQVKPISQNRIKQCVVHVGKAVSFNNEIQVTNFVQNDQGPFAIDKLLILQNLKKDRCDEVAFEDFAQFNLSADQLAKPNEDLYQKMSCLKKDSTCIGIYFLEYTPSSGVFLLKTTYYFVHLLTVGILPYYSGVKTNTVVTFQDPQSPVVRVKQLENDASYWSWLPLIFHPDRLNPRMATERATQKQYYESVIEGLNDPSKPYR